MREPAGSRQSDRAARTGPPVGAQRAWALAARLLGALLLIGGAGLACGARAHDLPYVLADVSLQRPGVVEMALRAHLGPLVLGLPQGAPDEAALDRLDRLSDREMTERAAVAAAQLRALISVRADGRLVDTDVRFPSVAAIRAEILAQRTAPAPSAPIMVTARIPLETHTVDVALPPSLGPAVLKVQRSGGRTSTTALPDGERSLPLRIAEAATLGARLETAVSFAVNGFRHIIPGGVDHMLFIAALVLGSPRLGALVKLATTFTIAHSITLGLAALGFVAVPAALIEPAITFSIAAAAGLALLRPEAGDGPARLVLVFAFGLLHGLGFAGILAETGLPQGDELLALGAFNVGVELAQLAVILTLLAGFRLARRLLPAPSGVIRPATVAVALAGLAWTVQRLATAFSASPFS